MTMPLQPKAIHDEMNATTFDEFGRMQANLGVEAQPPVPGAQNVVLYPFINPSTELIDATNLPKGDINVRPISSAADGTQIWRITHNGVDTHPIHFHLYDVQVLNRVTWDNIIIAPDPYELGWKDTVRISPLEDTIVALRPIIPTVPWELPNAIRPLSPMAALGSTMGFNNVDPQGNPTNPILNQLVNFGWEYVYHCHILSHEEMDMMRPVSVAIPPNTPDGLTFTIFGKGNNSYVSLSWKDNSINETSFVVQRDDGTGWTDIATISSPLDQPNTHGTLTYDDHTYNWKIANSYRILAKNTVGYGAEFPTLTVQSISASLLVDSPPNDPTKLTAVYQAGPQVLLNWTDNASNETNYVVERSVNGGPFTTLATLGANSTNYLDTAVTFDTNFDYRVYAFNTIGNSAYSNVATITTPPVAPSNVQASASRQNNRDRVILTWLDNSVTNTSYQIQRARDANFTQSLVTVNVGANITTFNTGYILNPGTDYYFRIRAVNATGTSAWVNANPFPIRTP